MYQQARQIIDIALRVPFTTTEMQLALEAVKVRRSKGTDLTFGHPLFVTDGEGFADTAGEGVIFMHSPSQLASGFMFIKLDAGRSFFGGQKAVYASYLGSLDADEWTAGPTFKSWGIATTSIGNIYRGNGYR